MVCCGTCNGGDDVVRRAWKICFAAIFAAWPTGYLHAQVTGTWLAPGSGTWIDPANWNSYPAYPGDGGRAVFGEGSTETATITLNSSITLSSLRFEPTRVFNFNGLGTVELTGPAVVDVIDLYQRDIANRPAIFWLPVSGASGLNATGGGILRLNDAAYTGETTVSNGTRFLVGNTTFGSSQGTISLNNASFGFTGGAAGHYLLSPVNVGSASGTISSSANSKSIGLLAPIHGSGTLAIRSSVPVSLQAPSPLSGSLDIMSRTTILADGAFPSLSELSLSSSLTLSSGSTNGSLDRLPDTAPISFKYRADGIPQLLVSTPVAPGAQPVVEQVGTLIFERTGGVGGTSNATLSVAGMVRRNNSVVWLSADGGPSAAYLRITGPAPAMIGTGLVGTPDVGIVPWISNWDGTPISINQNGQLRPLTANEFITSLPSSDTASNLLLSANAVIAQPASVNSLTITGGTLSGSAPLKVLSGRVCAPNSLADSTPDIRAPIDFGSVEGIIISAKISGVVSGTNGVTLVNGKLLGANTYTGTTTILETHVYDNVPVGVPGPFGIDQSAAELVGTLYFQPSQPMTFSRDLVMHDYSRIQINSDNRAITLAGTVVVARSAFFSSNYAGSTVKFAGGISGAGTIIESVGQVYLDAQSPLFTGTFSTTGTVYLNADQPFGTGTLRAGFSTLMVSNPRYLPNNLFFSDPVTIAGSASVTIDGAANLGYASPQLTVNAPAATITGSISNGSLTKSGPGLLSVGEARLSAISVSQGPMRILAGGEAAGVSVVNSLGVAAAATLDLTDNSLIVDYLGASPAESVRGMLLDGRLISSLSGPTHRLGYADNSELGLASFAAQPIDASSILIDFTFAGDANLDQRVDIRDLLALASHWQTAIDSWTAGDFNYDSTVDAADLTLLAMNWQAGVAAAPAMSLSDVLASLSLPNISVPEPGTTLALLAASLVPTITRRRRER